MSDITCLDYAGNQIKNYYQWDSNQKIKISGVNLDYSLEVHFSHPDSSEALVVTPSIWGDYIIVDVPNLLLQQAKPLIVYVFHESSDFGLRTIISLRIPVYPRPRPADYVYTETEVLTWQDLDKRVSDLEKGDNPAGMTLLDRTTGKKYAIYIDNGKLTMEEV